MSSSNYSVTWELNAKDNASAAMNSVMAVMRNGSNVSAQTMQQFKQTSQSVSAQTRAMSVLRNEWAADNPAAMQLQRSLASIGSIGQTTLSIVNSLMLAQLSMAQTQATLAGAQQGVKDAQINYNQAVAEFGPNSLPALQALQSLHEKQNALTQAQAEANRTSQTQMLQYAGIGLTLVGTASQVMNASEKFGTLTKILNLSSASAALMAIKSGLASAATAVWSGIQVVFDAIMDANPIGLVILAVAGLVAVIGIVTDGFRNWTPVIKAVNDAFKVLYDALNYVLTPFGGVNGAVAILTAAWKDLTPVIQAGYGALNFLYGGLNNLLSPFGGVAGAMRDLEGAGEAVFGFFRGIFEDEIQIWIQALNAFWNTLKPIVQAVQSFAGTVGSSLGGLFGGGSSGSNSNANQLAQLQSQLTSAHQVYMTDQMSGNASATQQAAMTMDNIRMQITSLGGIPEFGKGGIVNSATLAMIGESGPEAVVPLGSSGGGSVTVNINVQGVTTLNEMTDQIDRALFMRYSRMRRS